MALALGDDWEVRLATEQGTFHRPFARVIQVPSIELVPESWSRTLVLSSYQIVAFPVEATSADVGMIQALNVVEAFWNAFTGPGIDVAHPARIPLYDYSTIPLDGPLAYASPINRFYNDYLKLEGAPDITPYQDPQDELLWSVAANIRVSWLRSSVVLSPGNPVQSVRANSSWETP